MHCIGARVLGVEAEPRAEKVNRTRPRNELSEPTVGITGRVNTSVGLKMRKIWVHVVSNGRNRFYQHPNRAPDC
jgi:hypothetical protein